MQLIYLLDFVVYKGAWFRSMVKLWSIKTMFMHGTLAQLWHRVTILALNAHCCVCHATEQIIFDPLFLFILIFFHYFYTHNLRRMVLK